MSSDEIKFTSTRVSGPVHGDVSGYIDWSGRWMFSVWDEDRMDWRDVGYDSDRADAICAEMRASLAEGGASS